MRKKFLLITCFLFLISIAFGSTLKPNSTDAGLQNVTINITLDSVIGNATAVNITLPSVFTFVDDSNQTSENAKFNNFDTNLIGWENKTTCGFLNSTGWFSFKVNVNKNVLGNFSIIINITNTTSDKTSEVLYIFVHNTSWSQPKEEFYIKPTAITLTLPSFSFSINISLNQTVNYDVIISIDNSTISSAETEDYGTSLYSGYIGCKDPAGYYRLVLVKNNTHYNTTFLVTPGTPINISFVSSEKCPPGRYKGKIKIYNKTNTVESLNLSFTLDIPLKNTNQINVNTLTGSFKGTFPANSSEYHEYLFKTSSSETIENATYVTLNIDNNFGIFLFDENNSFLNSNFFETKPSYKLSKDKFWKIRVFSNFSSPISKTYNANIYFSTLNSSKELIDFGSVNFSQSKSQTVTIKNEGNVSLYATLSTEMWREEKKSSTAPNNFTFYISPKTTKIKLLLEWNDSNRYKLRLFDKDGNLVAESSDQSSWFELVGAGKKEFLIYSSSIGSNRDGKWKVEVTNLTNSGSFSYTLTLFEYINPSDWISTNYTAKTFKPIGTQDSETTVNITLTIPNYAIGYHYKGYLIFQTNNSAKFKLPFEFNLTSGGLVFDNNFDYGEKIYEENIGFNRTITLNVTIKNIGNTNVSISISNLTGLMNNTNSSLSDKFVRYKILQYPSSLNSSESKNLTVNITINTTETENYRGIYEKDLTLNITEQGDTTRTYTVTLKLNLTSRLIVNVFNFETADGDKEVENPSSKSNITAYFIVNYLDGTNITNLNISNFTFGLREGNVTSYTVDNLAADFKDPLSDAYSSTEKKYIVNTTIPSGLLGGRYNLILNVDHYREKNHFSGTGISYPLIINNVGLYMEVIGSDSFVLEPEEVDYLHVRIWNFGPKNGDKIDEINFTENSQYFSVHFNNTNCSGEKQSPGGIDIYKLSLPGYSFCDMWWKIIASVNGDGKTYTAHLYGSGRWFNKDIPIEIKVINTTTGTADGTTNQTSGGLSEGTPNLVEDISITSYDNLVIIEENKSNTTKVKVKNTGNLTTEVNFEVKNINSNWYKIVPLKMSLSPNDEDFFAVLFDLKNTNADIGEYSGKFKAYTSSVSREKSFTLRVIPGEERKKEINETLTNFTELFNYYQQLLEELKTKGYDTSIAEQKLDLLSQKINELENYLENKDYYHGYFLVSDISSMISDLNTTVSNLEKTKKGFDWKIILIIIAIVGGGFLGYLFWPTTPYYSQKRRKFIWKKRDTKSVIENLKKVFKKS